MKDVDFQKAFAPSAFSENAQETIAILHTYLENVFAKDSSDKVLESLHWKDIFARVGNANVVFQEGEWTSLLKDVIKYSQHLHNPRYIGHQVAVPLPLAAIIDLVTSFLNNSTAIVEMGPIESAIEQKVITWIAEKIGYDNQSGGFFTAGGSLGNLMALLAARQNKAGYDVWDQGVKKSLCVLVSDQAHYCVKRATQIMGLGEEGAISIRSDDSFQITLENLEEAYQNARNKQKKVIAVVGSCCNTGPGTFENLTMIADFCENNNLWFHVDGAHGSPALLSKKYASLAQGINRADSVVWDLHKMMMMPSLCTAVIFRKSIHSYQSLKQEAPYLHSGEIEEDWHAISLRTMECTKPATALKAYFCIRYYGEHFFAKYIDWTFDLAKEFAFMIESDESFEYAVYPQGNIVCFRFITENHNNLDILQIKIRNKIITSGKYYIVYTTLKNKVYLRTTIMNCFTTKKQLQELLELIKQIGNTVCNKNI